MAMKNKRRKHLVKQQIGVVITDLEKVISELNTVVRELKGVLNQIERVSIYLDDEQTKANERESKKNKRVVKRSACVVKSCENGVVLPRMCSPCKSLSQYVTVRNGLNGTKCAFAASPQKCRHEYCVYAQSPHHVTKPRDSDAGTSGDDGSPRRDGCSGDAWCLCPKHDLMAWDQRSLSFPSPAHSLTAKLRESKSICGSQTSCSDDAQSSDFQADYNRDINTWTTYAMVHIDASSDAWSADEAPVCSEVLSPTHSHHSGEKRIMHVSPLVVES